MDNMMYIYMSVFLYIYIHVHTYIYIYTDVRTILLAMERRYVAILVIIYRNVAIGKYESNTWKNK